jgi:AIPR protein/abortive infection phage resistance-like protein
MSQTIEEFLVDVQQRIMLDAERDERSLAHVFTDYMREVLTEAGEIDDGETALHQSAGPRAVAVSGFNVSDDDRTIDILVTDYQALHELRALGKADVTSHFKKLRRFAERCGNLLGELEESTDAWRMAQRLSGVMPGAERLRLTLLTNARVKTEPPGPETFGSLRITHHVWDLERLFRLESSGRDREPIMVDLHQLAGEALPVLGPKGVPGDYEAYLLLIPGAVLADVYEEYGSRLLELNVRSFLQARGKVNQGIQQTIANEPTRFLAYNNGISMTASSVELDRLPNGGSGIARIHDLQIVNGGQTTASLYYARARSKRDLSDINVQAKLSVVPSERLDELVPRISEYANSQNTVKSADFSANDPFQRELERLSRTIWAPAADGSQKLTRWFYERARGQYADAVALAGTPARQREFKTQHPPTQVIRKTDVAKYELTWGQRPDLVSLGGEKVFREFMLRLNDQPDFKPDQTYFERLVAKAKLFQSTEKIITALKLGGYRSQTVTYTLALMSKRTSQQIDLNRIWRQQQISDELAMAIEGLGERVHRKLISSAGTANIAEWAKKDGAWQAIQDLDWRPDDSLKGGGRQADLNLEEKWTQEAKDAAIKVMSVSAAGWQDLFEWGARTGNFDQTERRTVSLVRDMQRRKGQPTPNLMVLALAVLNKAEEVGFTFH